MLTAGCGGPDRSGAGPSGAGPSAPGAEAPGTGSSSGTAEKRFARLPSALPRTELRAQQDGDWFENVAKPAGIGFKYRSGVEAGLYQLLESVGGGVSLVDFDQDGNVDIFLTGGGSFAGSPVKTQGAAGCMYRNLGGWKFADVTDSLNLSDSSLYTHGSCAGDYNRDGWPDLLVAGYGGIRLFENQQGKSFKDVTTAAGLGGCTGWNTHAVFADFNLDGWLDLYVVTYAKWKPDATQACENDQQLQDICGPTIFPGAQDQLFMGSDGGKFKNVTEQAGIVDSNRGLGVVVADFNNDRWPDIFVANDVEQNQLYLGGKDFPYREEGILSGVAFSARGDREGSMGITTGDFNRDGRQDLFYTNYANQDNSLCQLVGPASFVPASDKTGLTGVSRRWVGFGVLLSDFDMDGWPDIVIANGHVAYDRRDSPYFQPPQLFKNQNGERLEEISLQGGPYFSGRYSGRGVAVGDLDNNGAPDVVMVHQDEPPAVLKNRLPAANWIRLKLRGVQSNTDAFGARLTVNHGGRAFNYWLQSNDGYLSSSDRRILIPLLNSQPVDVTVQWPAGKTEVFSSLTLQATHELVEGMGRQPPPD